MDVKEYPKKRKPTTVMRSNIANKSEVTCLMISCKRDQNTLAIGFVLTNWIAEKNTIPW